MNKPNEGWEWLNSMLPQIFPNKDPHDWENVRNGNLEWDIKKQDSKPFYRNIKEKQC